MLMKFVNSMNINSNIKEYCLDLYGTCEPDNCRCKTSELTESNRHTLRRRIEFLKSQASKGKIVATQDLKEVWGLVQDYIPGFDDGLGPKE